MIHQDVLQEIQSLTNNNSIVHSHSSCSTQLRTTVLPNLLEKSQLLCHRSGHYSCQSNLDICTVNASMVLRNKTASICKFEKICDVCVSCSQHYITSLFNMPSSIPFATRRHSLSQTYIIHANGRISRTSSQQTVE